MPHELAVTSHAQAFLVPLFDIFKVPDVAIALAGGMIVLALLLLLWFLLLKIWPVRRSLGRAAKSLRGIANHDAFISEFATVDDAMTAEPLLEHGWSEFRKTLIMPLPGESVPIRNTARPSDYLNIDSVSSELSLPGYQALPNYFVGVGLLFTFLGLVAAIYFASQGVAGDVAQAKESLGNLLTAATFKFSTSIAGLLSSIILSIFIKGAALWIQGDFVTLCKLVEKRVEFVTPESLAAEQIRELKKQSLQLERFNTDFAVEVARALEDRFNASLGPVINEAMAPMREAIDGMARNFGDINQSAMKDMVGEFTTSLRGAAGTEMDALAQTLEGLKTTLQSMITGVGQSGGDFGSRIDQAAGRLEDMISGAASLMETSVAESASRLEKILGGASESLRGDAEKVSAELSGAISGIARDFQGGLAAAATQWNGSLTSSAEGLQSAVDRAGESLAGRVDDATQKFGDVVAPFAAEIKGLERTLHVLDGRLKAQLDGFDGSLAGFRDVIGSMGQSLTHIHEAGAPIAQTAERFGRAAQQIEATSQAVKQSHDQLSEVARTIRDGAKLVQDSWESYRQRFENVDSDLTATFARIQEGTTAYHQRVSEYVVEIDKHFTGALKMLGAGIDDLGETVEELSEAADRMSRAKVSA